MNRRKFLKMLSLAFGALAVGLAIPAASAAAALRAVSYNGRLYRAEGGGRIGVSVDNGVTWGLHSDLGNANVVTKLQVTPFNQLKATLKFSGRKFVLVLAADQLRWRTT